MNCIVLAQILSFLTVALQISGGVHAAAFVPQSTFPSTPTIPGARATSRSVQPAIGPLDQRLSSTALSAQNSNKQDKFSFQQRIESIKTAFIGAVSGGVASTPFIFLHDVLFPVNSSYTSGFASWEFDTDMGSIEAALFAILYRYCVREEDENEMLNMGVVGAFVVVRTLGRIHVPSYCTAAPLDCGDPIGYFDWNMIQQLALNGIESATLFGATAAALEYAYGRNWVSKFPN